MSTHKDLTHTTSGQSADFLSRAYSLKDVNAAKNLYEEWAQSYDADLESSSYASPQFAVAAVAKHIDNDSGHLKILDAGCGTGLVGLHVSRSPLASSPGFTIDGLDLSPGMLAIARQKSIYHDLDPADLSKPIERVDGSYRVITCVGTLTKGHVGPKVINEFVRVVSQGGLVVATVHEEVWESAGYRHVVEALEKQEMVEVVGTEEMGFVEGDQRQGDAYIDTPHTILHVGTTLGDYCINSTRVVSASHHQGCKLGTHDAATSHSRRDEICIPMADCVNMKLTLIPNFCNLLAPALSSSSSESCIAISSSDAAEFVAKWGTTLTKMPYNGIDWETIADEIIYKDFVSYSNSIRSSCHLPVGNGTTKDSISHASKAQWIKGLGVLPPIDKFAPSLVQVSCNHITAVWTMIPEGVGYVRQIMVYEMVKSQGKEKLLQVRRVDYEYDNAAWTTSDDVEDKLHCKYVGSEHDY
ncbi:hypothetical protein DOTSEDRAFT_34872 [Dothistroma septosporum NZE10]|uniref:Uncharacterized protein n=1 Tax=Dothistroma septosporum (strain NZE10 / CBS 128990) TaxID=675120 RepID=N1PNE1_DOTSN|nr:hypothetical protein DOTSEDRAFT_34872 [Dothistroma septosporum NZE10]